VSPNLLTLLLGSLIVGALLLFIGLLGRRINKHPVCRDCGFDLEGVYPDAVTCPECGSGLKRASAVVIGARRKLWPLVFFGALLSVAPVIPLAAVLFAAATGRNIDTYKPLGLLLWEATYADALRTDSIANELLNRAQSKALTTDQHKSVIAYALDLQADAARPWAETWGDIIVDAHLSSLLAADDLSRFERQQAVFDVTTRDRAHPGATLPVVVRLTQMRCDSRTGRAVTLALGSVTIDGNDVVQPRSPARSLDPFGGSPFSLLESSGGLGTIFIGGKKGNNPFTGITPTTTTIGVPLTLPADLKPGPTKVSFTLEQSGGIGGGLGAFGGGPGRMTITVNGAVLGGGAMPGGALKVADLSFPITIVDPATPLLTAQTPDPAILTSLSSALRPQSIIYSMNMTFRSPFDLRGQQFNASVAFPAGKIDTTATPLAHDVILRNPRTGREFKLGELTTGTTLASLRPKDTGTFVSQSFTMIVNGRTVTSTSSSTPKDPDTLTISGSAPLVSRDTATVILRPNPALAASTTDMISYLDSEIIFNDVEVDRSLIGGMD
jgi:hypothetical protein